jgi:hypothetical protein
VAWTLSAALAQPAGPDRAALCGPVDRPPADTAQALTPLGDAARSALVSLAAAASPADVLCGIAGLAALRDPGVVGPVDAALKNPALQADAFRIARWAAFAAGGPSPELGTAFAPLVKTLEDPAVWAAAGNDGIRLLGEIDHPSARDRLVAEVGKPQLDATLDAIIHALARQGDPRVRERMIALGQEAVSTRSGNLTYEQASRIGTVALYLLALSPESRADGLQFFRQLAVRDQEDTAAWALQTWCERAARRPAEREAAQRARAALQAELQALNVRWDHLQRGAFRCETP